MNALIFATILMVCTPTEVLDWDTNPLVAITYSGSTTMLASAVQLRANGTTWVLSGSKWVPLPKHDWLSDPTGENTYEVYWNQEDGQIISMTPPENTWVTLDSDMTWKFDTIKSIRDPQGNLIWGDRNASMMITIRQKGKEYGISKRVSIHSLTSSKPPHDNPQ